MPGVMAMKVGMLIVLVSMAAQAAEPTGTLTLACKGEKTSTSRTEPISMGIIFNFREHTILGFEAPGFEGARIDVTDVAITFSGEYKNREGTAVVGKIDGKIDRITGNLEASVQGQIPGAALHWKYSMPCKPTQRLF
jgi:hypothetical protein